jgi:hypothetical protein
MGNLPKLEFFNDVCCCSCGLESHAHNLGRRRKIVLILDQRFEIHIAEKNPSTGKSFIFSKGPGYGQFQLLCQKIEQPAWIVRGQKDMIDAIDNRTTLHQVVCAYW